jgi:DinB superfamily
MRVFMLITMFGAAAAFGIAGDRVTKMYEDQLKLVDEHVTSLARAMPTEKYGFAPTGGAFEGVRTFGEQIRHLATMIFMTAAIVLQEPTPHGPGKNDNGPDSIESKSDTLKYLEESLAYARKAIASISEKNHLDPLKTFFGPMPRAAVLEGIFYHSFDHYGQMVMYARMNGIVPPASVPPGPPTSK